MFKKVLVAMSGGVDSSVACALLKQQGFFVTGGFMKNFDSEAWNGVIKDDCPWQNDLRDARAVCRALGVELKIFNFQKEYEKQIIDYFFKEYALGRTPNPDILCNSEIKFGLFLKNAEELGYDYIATGHYAKIKQISPKKQGEKTRYQLLKGIDLNKDQSYFLHRLTQRQLSRSLFPLGPYTKNKVRELAQKFKLPNAQKKDSQGLCFIGHINLRKFLQQRIPKRQGHIVTTQGQIIGQHEGMEHLTLGQRHGLGIGGGTPYYVAQKNLKTNTLVVAMSERDPALLSRELLVNNINWINQAPTLPFSCRAKIRYRQEEQKCAILSKNKTPVRVPKTVLARFERKQFAPAPGQSVVFYKNNQVIGGGIIANAR